jgi:hypothetical protein
VLLPWLRAFLKVPHAARVLLHEGIGPANGSTDPFRSRTRGYTTCRAPPFPPEKIRARNGPCCTSFTPAPETGRQRNAKMR